MAVQGLKMPGKDICVRFCFGRTPFLTVKCPCQDLASFLSGFL